MDVKPAFPLHTGPLRTMWEASRDIINEACRVRDPEMWRRGFRLWVYASVTQAPGTPYILTPAMVEWLP